MLVMLGSKYFLSQHHDIELELAKRHVVSHVVVYCQLEISLRVSLNIMLTTLGPGPGKKYVFSFSTSWLYSYYSEGILRSF